MGVKRFDYILGTGPSEGWMEEAAHGEYVKASDYDVLAAARQHEFAYIEKVLKACSNATASDIRDELRDLRAWAANRSTCFSVETEGLPKMSTVEIPSFDNWFRDKYGDSWENMWLCPGMSIHTGMRGFLTAVQDYLTHVARMPQRGPTV